MNRLVEVLWDEECDDASTHGCVVCVQTYLIVSVDMVALLGDACVFIFDFIVHERRY